MRNVPLKRGDSQPKRSGGIERATPVRPRPSRPETGLPRAVKLAARTRAGKGDRDEACCEYCGKRLGPDGGEVQRRLALGSGKTRGAVANGICNAAVLCDEHCRLAQAQDETMRVRGWWIRSGKGPDCDPQFVPVVSRTADADGDLAPRWFTADGRETTEEQVPLPPGVKPVTQAEFREAYRVAGRRADSEARRRC